MRTEMIKILVEKLAKYYNYIITEVDYEFWIDVFGEVTEWEFKTAARQFLKGDAIYMPKAGQVYQIVAMARADAMNEGLPTVAAGVSEIRDSLGEYERAPKYSHPLLDKTVELLGYWHLGHIDSRLVSDTIGKAYGELRKNFMAGREPIVEHALLDWKRVREIGEENGTRS